MPAGVVWSLGGKIPLPRTGGAPEARWQSISRVREVRQGTARGRHRYAVAWKELWTTERACSHRSENGRGRARGSVRPPSFVVSCRHGCHDKASRSAPTSPTATARHRGRAHRARGRDRTAAALARRRCCADALGRARTSPRRRRHRRRWKCVPRIYRRRHDHLLRPLGGARGARHRRQVIASRRVTALAASLVRQ